MATVAKGAAEEDCVENIDIGGPALIRAAAKNHDFVAILTEPEQYAVVLDELAQHGGTKLATRKRLAGEAYARTAAYDAAVSGWFAGELEKGGDKTPPRRRALGGLLRQSLRYGENPHQEAAFYVDGSNRPGVATTTQLQGKELSYNNINDTDAAYELVAEFDPKIAPACAIIKHANPCGVAVGATPLEAYQKAFKTDPTSAFGGIIAFNRELDAETAQAVSGQFVEVLIAPAVSAAAKALLAKKENVRVLEVPLAPGANLFETKRIGGGMLVQSPDDFNITAADLKVVTKRAPTEAEFADLRFAFRVAKHVKSNAIVYAKHGATVGIGAGQMSHIDSARIAAWKAEDAAKLAHEPETLTSGSVVASDAFFPFADGLLAAAKAGATAVIQPGGSMRDDEVIAAADAHNLAMVFTGTRHFRH